MKKLMIPLAAALLMGSTAFATTSTAKAQPTQKDVPAKQSVEKQTQDQIKLYADASKDAKVLATITLDQRIVPFYNKGGWVKVGDPANGQVGWIHKEQYRKAMNQAISESVQTVYIEQDSDNNQKPQITVYKNGKKLTGKEAQAIYQKVQKQQTYMQNRFERFQKQMQNFANEQMLQLNSSFNMLPVVQPIVIVENNPAKTKTTEK